MTETQELTMTIGGGASLEPGTYEATLTALEDFHYDDGEGEKTLRRWTFGTDEVDAATGEAISIDGVSSLATGPKSKAFAWLTALIGRTPTTGESFTPSTLVGRPCMVTVILNDDGYSKVSAVVPPPKRKPVAAPAPAFVAAPAAAVEATAEAASTELPF